MTREEAIKKVRWGLMGLVIDKDFRDALETLIPELQESEDERIRKNIVAYLKYERKSTQEEINEVFIPWLEKQKEQKDYRKLYEDIAKSEWFKKAYEGKSLGYDDEQKEQKPVEPKFKVGDRIKLSEEPKYPFREIVNIKDGAYYFDEFVHLPFKEQDKWEKEQKPESITSDVKEYTIREDYTSAYYEERGYKRGYNNGYADGVRDTKAVIAKSPVEPKPMEWSEEDEKIFNELLDHCNTENATWYNFLKSLRPHWKPSEEQMEALRECGECKRCIKELYESLQKRYGTC